MTAFLNNDFHTGAKANLQIWICDSCNCVHVRAADVLLTFTEEEFAGFTQAVLDCHYKTSFFGTVENKEITDDSLPILVSELES